MPVCDCHRIKKALLHCRWRLTGTELKLADIGCPTVGVLFSGIGVKSIARNG